MPQSKFSDFKDELGETVRETTKFVKKQTDQLDPKANKKVDPMTGKPVPSKKMLTQLTQQTAQLAQVRLKKVREELAKQRLKVNELASAKDTAGEAGPEVKHEEAKPKEDAIAKTLKGSKSTGEFKGLIGG